LPVGRDCIEVYPFIEREQGRLEYAPMWAEHDILASVVANQFREGQFETLDPNASASSPCLNRPFFGPAEKLTAAL
jgi:hypothetical protein